HSLDLAGTGPPRTPSSSGAPLQHPRSGGRLDLVAGTVLAVLLGVPGCGLLDDIWPPAAVAASGTALRTDRADLPCGGCGSAELRRSANSNSSAAAVHSRWIRRTPSLRRAAETGGVWIHRHSGTRRHRGFVCPECSCTTSNGRHL